MAKRVSSSSVNWTMVLNSFGKIDRQKVVPLKIQSEKFLKEIASKPAELPKIDWNFYKTRITTPGMIESFQKTYEALKVPYPSDQGELSKTEASNNKINEGAKKEFEELLADIASMQKKLKELEGVMKYSEMTLEEFFLARPDMKIDPDKPKFWPQNLNFDEPQAEAKK